MGRACVKLGKTPDGVPDGGIHKPGRIGRLHDGLAAAGLRRLTEFAGILDFWLFERKRAAAVCGRRRSAVNIRWIRRMVP